MSDTVIVARLYEAVYAFFFTREKKFCFRQGVSSWRLVPPIRRIGSKGAIIRR